MTDAEPDSSDGFDTAIRNLIDTAFSNGVDPEEIEEILEYHADGVEYYWQDMNRYAAALAQAQPQTQSAVEEREPRPAEDGAAGP